MPALTSWCYMHQAELTAFSTLTAVRLLPAIEYGAWCEGDAFGQHTRVRLCLLYHPMSAAYLKPM